MALSKQIGRRKWNPADRWYSVAYLEYRDSREWRYLLELNPSYDIRYHPAPNVPINTRGYTGAGEKTPVKTLAPGLLKTPDTNLQLMIEKAPVNDTRQPSFFPWSSADSYLDRLGDYTASAILGSDRTNGFTLDSPQAGSDSQRG